MAHAVPIGQVYGNEPNSPRCLLCETAISVRGLLLTSLPLSLFSPDQPDHPPQACQAQVVVACGMFSGINKSCSLLGYLKCEAKPKAQSHYCPLWVVATKFHPLHHCLGDAVHCFKTRRCSSHQKWSLRPVGNRQSSTQPRQTTLTRPPSRVSFMKLPLANTI